MNKSKKSSPNPNLRNSYKFTAPPNNANITASKSPEKKDSIRSSTKSLKQKDEKSRNFSTTKTSNLSQSSSNKNVHVSPSKIKL